MDLMSPETYSQAQAYHDYVQYLRTADATVEAVTVAKWAAGFSLAAAIATLAAVALAYWQQNRQFNFEKTTAKIKRDNTLAHVRATANNSLDYLVELNDELIGVAYSPQIEPTWRAMARIRMCVRMNENVANQGIDDFETLELNAFVFQCLFEARDPLEVFSKPFKYATREDRRNDENIIGSPSNLISREEAATRAREIYTRLVTRIEERRRPPEAVLRLA